MLIHLHGIMSIPFASHGISTLLFPPGRWKKKNMSEGSFLTTLWPNSIAHLVLHWRAPKSMNQDSAHVCQGDLTCKKLLNFQELFSQILFCFILCWAARLRCVKRLVRDRCRPAVEVCHPFSSYDALRNFVVWLNAN